MRTKIAVFVLWAACFVFNRGYLMGGLTMEYPAYREDVAATMFALGGPLTLPEGVYYATSGAPYMWRGYSCQQRWDAFDFKDLGKVYFVRRNYDCRVEDLL